MDPYNLAICFGPTLVPVPEDKDQVQYQNLVNELIKNIIINAEDIFPNDGGVVYERYISREPDEGYVLQTISFTRHRIHAFFSYIDLGKSVKLHQIPCQKRWILKSTRQKMVNKGDPTLRPPLLDFLLLGSVVTIIPLIFFG